MGRRNNDKAVFLDYCDCSGGGEFIFGKGSEQS